MSLNAGEAFARGFQRAMARGLIVSFEEPDDTRRDNAGEYWCCPEALHLSNQLLELLVGDRCVYLLSAGKMCLATADPPLEQNAFSGWQGWAQVPLCAAHADAVVEAAVEKHQEDLEAAIQRREEAVRELSRIESISGKVVKRGATWAYRLSWMTQPDGSRPTRFRGGYTSSRAARSAMKEALDEEQASLRASLRSTVDGLTSRIDNTLGARARRTFESRDRIARNLAASAKAAKEEGLRERRERERLRFVYYVRRPDGAIKIGTTWNIESRLRAFLNVVPVELLATHGGGQPAEAALHRRFRAHRLDGEWFAPSQEILDHIAHVASCSDRRPS